MKKHRKSNRRNVNVREHPRRTASGVITKVRRHKRSIKVMKKLRAQHRRQEVRCELCGSDDIVLASEGNLVCSKCGCVMGGTFSADNQRNEILTGKTVFEKSPDLEGEDRAKFHRLQKEQEKLSYKEKKDKEIKEKIKKISSELGGESKEYQDEVFREYRNLKKTPGYTQQGRKREQTIAALYWLCYSKRDPTTSGDQFADAMEAQKATRKAINRKIDKEKKKKLLKTFESRKIDDKPIQKMTTGEIRKKLKTKIDIKSLKKIDQKILASELSKKRGDRVTDRTLKEIAELKNKNSQKRAYEQIFEFDSDPDYQMKQKIKKQKTRKVIIKEYRYIIKQFKKVGRPDPRKKRLGSSGKKKKTT